MSQKIGLFTGTFDPMTLGHLDIIERASKLFDLLYVGIFNNDQKSPLFKTEERRAMLEETLADFDNVKVIVHEAELTVKVAEKLGVTALVRSVRDASDLAYEENMFYFNLEMSGLDTLLLMARPELKALNSTRMRELYHFDQDLSDWLPEPVKRALEAKRTSDGD
ncbi:pantetheine-phosphate adenylyltransferase [Lactococcus termiticola]|uniref:Phosphopantetheine adenylyltransferase n=1 Tax=Lactococcus termiticola TaxID=2169526 RepID=A0A2R5HFH9_9LACT|nr:pantetheine-phosphate adenylyltransferase [Lactococcus termiticola]GBG96807.1 phosphopantetheine adenylyltransferase [Lactococcus termiticola]